jgi:16S rRNA (guanine527-N7)-methyltransferase
VRVERGRAEDLIRTGWVPVGVATARAVAPLTKLASWTLPLLAPGGVLLALKGASAQEEIEASGLSQARVVVCGAGVVDPPTTVVVVPAAQ